MMTAEDADGTVMDLRCLPSEQGCTLNSAPETFGGVVYPANTVITMTIRTDLHLVTSGSTAGLQLPATVIYGGFTDLAGNGWDLQGSADVVLGSPD